MFTSKNFSILTFVPTMLLIFSKAVSALNSLTSTCNIPRRVISLRNSQYSLEEREIRHEVFPSFLFRRRVRRRIFSRLLKHNQAAIDSVVDVNESEIDPGEVAGLKILKYPHPALRAPNVEVAEFGPDVKALARNMFKLMYAAKGVGLAAPQIGINKRLMVFNPDGDATKWLSESILINPYIVEKSISEDTDREGCLSFPGMRGEVSRSKWVKVEAYNVAGKKFKKKYEGWIARIFQHEYDHLDAVVFIDRLDEESKKLVKPRLDELVQEYGEGGAL